MLLNGLFSLSDHDVWLRSSDPGEDVEVSAGREGDRHSHKELKVSVPRLREGRRVPGPSTLQELN